jgi:Ca2+-binding EF-hand superfamily protein
LCIVGCGHVAPQKATAPDEANAAARGFAMWDLNHDGYISHDEWRRGEQRMVEALPQANRANAIQQLEVAFRSIDVNHDGRISLSEYASDRDKPPDWAIPK